MGFFKRRPPAPFWEKPPFASSDPAVLHQAGISAAVSEDGKSAISVGWAIWQLAGIDQYQAANFIQDGYGWWNGSQDFSAAQAADFLSDLIEGLTANPILRGNTRALPFEEVNPIATHYGVRSWAVLKRLEVIDTVEKQRWEPEAFGLISASPRDFVPPMSQTWANEYASANGLSHPWT